MSKMLNSILQKYYNEANKGLNNDKAPSALNRGEGTEKEYYIFKIDLVGSTSFLGNKFPQTYLKLAHVFLSSIDEITRKFGADASQVEYAGDSVLAYFDVAKVSALDVLFAAYWSREAALKMKNLDPSFKNYNCKTKVVLHYGKLIMAKIGPWGDHRLSAIGKELHRVSKLEKKVPGGVGHVTNNFAQRLEVRIRRKLLSGVYESRNIETPQPTLSRLAQTGLSSYFNPPRPTILTGEKLGVPSMPPKVSVLSEFGYPVLSMAKPTLLTGNLSETTSKTQEVPTHWKVRWPFVERYINENCF
ncbi:adenylate cyclase [Thermodesulfobacteriota bacterium]